MAKTFITKSLECLYDEQDYDHTLHIPKNYNKDVSVISSTVNTICDMLNMLLKNQKTNSEKVEQQLGNLNVTTNKIEQKIQSLGRVIDLDLKKETKEQIHELTKTVNNLIIQRDVMSYAGDNKIPRLFYGTEDIMVLQNKKPKEEEYKNIVEVLDYWKTIYKDPKASMEERNHILQQIRKTCLEYEDLLSYFNYDINKLSDDESTSSESSESNQDDNEINTLSDNETDSEENTSDSQKKRKAEEPLHEFLNQEAFEEYLRTSQKEANKDFINTTEHTSSSEIKIEPDQPSPSYTRRDDMNKQTVAQNGTYLDLTHVPFKDQEKTIDDWAQSMSILITNYKTVWTKERFLDYLAATLQGDTLQWLKQWENSTEGKLQKAGLLTNFNGVFG
jgi:hypothetical protein